MPHQTFRVVGKEGKLLQRIIVDRSKEVIGIRLFQFFELASVILGYRRILPTVIDDLILRAGAGDHLGVLGVVTGDADCVILTPDVISLGHPRQTKISILFSVVGSSKSLRTSSIIVGKKSNT